MYWNCLLVAARVTKLSESSREIRRPYAFFGRVEKVALGGLSDFKWSAKLIPLVYSDAHLTWV
jgi:hypothetical protein